MNPARMHGLFSQRYTLHDRKTAIQFVVGLNIDQIGRGFAILRNKDRLPYALQLGNNLRSPSLKRGHKFSLHKCHLSSTLGAVKTGRSGACGLRLDMSKNSVARD